MIGNRVKVQDPIAVSSSALPAPSDFTVAAQATALALPADRDKRYRRGKLLLEGGPGVTVAGPIELYLYDNGRYRRCPELLSEAAIDAGKGAVWRLNIGDSSHILVVAPSVTGGTVTITFLAERQYD